MEVQIREVCLKCGGTGKNQLSNHEALVQAIARRNQFPGGVIAPNQICPEPVETEAARLQVCGYCKNGHNTRWISINELLSSGI